jgi:hypothetical protein
MNQALYAHMNNKRKKKKEFASEGSTQESVDLGHHCFFRISFMNHSYVTHLCVIYKSRVE